MKAILLAAGLGTRLLPFTNTLPKCLMPINGRPLMEYWLNSLTDAGISQILINLHHHKDFVLNWIEQSPFKECIQTSVEPELLGTAGTVLNNREFIDNEPVMVIHADNLCLADISQFIAAHQSRPPNTAITMMTFNTITPEQCGVVECDNNGVVQKFYEKIKHPPVKPINKMKSIKPISSKLDIKPISSELDIKPVNSAIGDEAVYIANGAVYIIEPEIVEFLMNFAKSRSDRLFIDLCSSDKLFIDSCSSDKLFIDSCSNNKIFIDFSTDVLPNYVGRIYTWHNDIYHRDIGTPESLIAAQKEIKCKIHYNLKCG